MKFQVETHEAVMASSMFKCGQKEKPALLVLLGEVGRRREKGAYSIQAVTSPGFPIPARVRRLFRRRESKRD